MKRSLLSLFCLLLAAPAMAASGELYVYNWSEYLPDSVLRDFTKETGVKVIMSTYDSNEAMYAKVRMMDGKGYDIIVPSTDFVARMRKEGLLLPLDKSRLTNLGNLDPSLMNQLFDPDNVYSVPYMWGSTAIAVNGKNADAVGIVSFADLWKPEFKGKILLPNDMRGVLGMGLKRLGYSLNEADPAKVAEACELLIPLMPGVRVFDSDSPKLALLNNEVLAGPYSGMEKPTPLRGKIRISAAFIPKRASACGRTVCAFPRMRPTWRMRIFSSTICSGPRSAPSSARKWAIPLPIWPPRPFCPRKCAETKSSIRPMKP